MVGGISSCTFLVILENRIITFLVLPLSFTWDLLLSNPGKSNQADELESAMKGTEATQEPVKSSGSSFQSHDVPGLKNKNSVISERELETFFLLTVGLKDLPDWKGRYLVYLSAEASINCNCVVPGKYLSSLFLKSSSEGKCSLPGCLFQCTTIRVAKKPNLLLMSSKFISFSACCRHEHNVLLWFWQQIFVHVIVMSPKSSLL